MSRSLEITITGCSWLCGIVLLGAVSTVIGYLLFKGFGTLGPQLLFGSVNPLEALLFKKQVFDGLFPAVVGTLLLVILSVGIAIPIGMTSGVYMAEYANGSVKKIFSLLFDILASIPSIVIGLFGFALAVFFTGIFPKDLSVASHLQSGAGLSCIAVYHSDNSDCSGDPAAGNTADCPGIGSDKIAEHNLCAHSQITFWNY